jgi:hypothetical protein
MNRTLRICCWVIVTLAVSMTIFMNLHARDSAIHPGILLPLAFLPYVVLAFTVRRSRTPATLVCTLSAALITLVIGLLFYYDGLFAHLSTLNAGLFITVPLMQLVPALTGWAEVRRRCREKKVKDETPAS